MEGMEEMEIKHASAPENGPHDSRKSLIKICFLMRLINECLNVIKRNSSFSRTC